MAAIAQVKDGKIIESNSAASIADSVKKNGSTMDKEAFLNLLVAQMKYQDPLEPTSNTEYISQLATFSSLEEMQNMRASLEASQATGLVGKTVIMGVETSGVTNYISGRVEQVRREGSKTYLSIDGSWYNLDDLDTVVDDEYMEATLIGEILKKRWLPCRMSANYLLRIRKNWLQSQPRITVLPLTSRIILKNIAKMHTISLRR